MRLEDIDEIYGTMMDVRNDPAGAHMAIQAQAAEIDRMRQIILEAHDEMKGGCDATAFATLQAFASEQASLPTKQKENE